MLTPVTTATKPQAFLGVCQLLLAYSESKSLTSERSAATPLSRISLNHMAPPLFAHLVVQVQSLEVAIEHEALHVAVQGEICVTAKSVDSYVMPVLVIEDSPSAHGRVTRPWLDGAAA